MARFLLLRLEAPFVAFGAEMIDARGPIRDWPGAGALTGLLANALGWRREERARHDRLQDRLVYGCRLDRPGIRFTEFQTAQLSGSDRAWTTRGQVIERAGGAETFASPHIRLREHDADVSILVALQLEPPDEAPTLDDLAAALVTPARPLFLGRKPCLPAEPILVGPPVEAEDLVTALASAPLAAPATAPGRRQSPENIAIILPDDGAAPKEVETKRVFDRRDFLAGIHAGARRVQRRWRRRADFPSLAEETRP